MDKAQALTGERFSWKWTHLPDYGFDGATAQFQKEWYIKKFGWGTEANLRRFLGKCEFVLDAGCGLGRDVNMYAQSTKGQVYGVDISDSVFLAMERLKDVSNAHFIRGDMMELPFDDEYFDFIACDQALHHTPNTHLAFKTLVQKLKVGGQIVVYVYKKKGLAREFADDGIRKFTTQMSEKDCLKFAEACTLFGRAVSKVSLDLQRFIYWDLFKCFWNDGFDYQTNVMINFDWYSPVYAWRHTPEEVKSWCKECGLEIIHFDVGESGISVRARK
jgi:ubiquinone/menaquinone biosynthesis C-methylase UbiE